MLHLPGLDLSSPSNNYGGTSPTHHQANIYSDMTMIDNTNNDDNDDDGNGKNNNNNHHVGIARLPPNQTLSQGSVEETFKDLLHSSDDRKDIFISKGTSGSCCCRGAAPYIWMSMCIILIIGGIVLTVLMARDVIPLAALTGPIYCYIIGIIGAFLLTLLGEQHFELDKAEKVLRTIKYYTFFKYWNSSEYMTSPYNIKFEDIDYVTVSGLQDGSFEEDFVEFTDDVTKKTTRLPVRIARRRMYAQEQRKKNGKANATTETTAIIDMTEQKQSGEKNDSNQKKNPESQTLTEGSDEWLKTKYFKPRPFTDGEGHELPCYIQLVRKGAHSEVYTNNKEHNAKINKTAIINLETVNASKALNRVKDWEAYLFKSGASNIRRSVPYTCRLVRKLVNPYDTQVEEITTSVSLKAGKQFCCIIIPSVMMYAGLLALIVIFGQDANKRKKAEEVAWNATGTQPWNATMPEFQPEFTAQQGTIMGSIAGAITFWILIVIWFFLQKVTLIVNKANRTFSYRIGRYFCDPEWCCFSHDDEANERSAVVKFDSIHNLEMAFAESADDGGASASGKKSSFANRVIRVNYKEDGSSSAMKHIVLDTIGGSSSNSVFRGWKRYFIEDLKIKLDHQAEDAAFARMMKGDDDNNNDGAEKNTTAVLKAKPFDPSLYVEAPPNLEEEEEQSPMIHAE